MGMDGNDEAGTAQWLGQYDYNGYASFLLGLQNSLERRTRVVTGYTRTCAHSLYARDKWDALLYQFGVCEVRRKMV